jgi:hypothetical protein
LTFPSQVCTDVIELGDKELRYHSGDVYRFLAGRQSRESKRASKYAEQEKALKQALGKGLSRKAAEKLALSKTKLPALLDKPRGYTVNFAFDNPQNKDPTIAVLDAGFGFAGAAPVTHFLSSFALFPLRVTRDPAGSRHRFVGGASSRATSIPSEFGMPKKEYTLTI